MFFDSVGVSDKLTRVNTPEQPSRRMDETCKKHDTYIYCTRQNPLLLVIILDCC